MNKFKKFKESLNLSEANITAVQFLNIQNKLASLKSSDLNNSIMSSKIDVLEDLVNDIHNTVYENEPNVKIIQSLSECYKSKKDMLLNLKDGKSVQLNSEIINNLVYVYDELTTENRKVFLENLSSDISSYEKVCDFCKKILEE